MSATAGIGLSLMVAAAAIMLVAVPRRRVSYLGFLFVAVTFAYHFFGEVAPTVFPGRDLYRDLVAQDAIDRWLVIAGAAMVSFALSYAFVTGRRGARLATTLGTEGPWPRWTTVLALTIPLWLVASGTQRFTGQDAGYWTGGIVSQFLLLLVPLTLLLYLAQARQPRVLIAILVQSLALVLLGQRSLVIGPIVVVAWAASLLGKPLGRRVVVTVVGSLAVLVVVLSSTRVTFGREVFSTGTGVDRAQALLQGVSGVGNRGSNQGNIGNDFVYRLDGNAWPAYVLSLQSVKGYVPQSSMLYNLTVSVPSFLFKSKLSQAVLLRDEESRIDYWYGIPSSAVPPGPDWLPTMLGTTLAYIGRWWLLVAAGALGWLLARWDASTHARPITFSRLIVGMGLAESILNYERDLQSVFTTLRGAVLIWLCWEAAIRLRGTRRAVRAAPSLDAPEPSASQSW